MVNEEENKTKKTYNVCVCVCIIHNAYGFENGIKHQ